MLASPRTGALNAITDVPGIEVGVTTLVAGDAVWLPPEVQRRLRRFVTAGGTLVSMGVQSWQRQATLTPRLRLVSPTPPASADLWGSDVSPLQRGTFDVTNATDEIGLFQGTEGAFSGFTSAEITRSTGSEPIGVPRGGVGGSSPVRISSCRRCSNRGSRSSRIASSGAAMKIDE